MRHTLVIKLAVLAALVSLNVSLPATAQLASALLPTSRSTEVGNTVTVFSTVINAGSEIATDCQIDQLSALPLSVGFQTTDPTTNETTGSAEKWWNTFREENMHRPALILRLSEELKIRKATISEFFLTYVNSKTDNIQANLHYLDYSRLKKEEENRKEKED